MGYVFTININDIQYYDDIQSYLGIYLCSIGFENIPIVCNIL